MNQLTGKKIGILTFHRCINYGSYWQARCLVDELCSRGADATLLHYDSRRTNLAEWRCAYRPVLPTPVPETDYSVYRRKIETFFQAFRELPLSPLFPLDHPEQMEEYDTVVVGSDEVWNIFHPWYSRCPLFFGEGLRAERIISYAASFGNYPAAWGLEPEWAQKLYNFDAIAVRDENSQTIVRNAVGIEADLVLDPCLQFPIPLAEQEYPPLQRPYLALYGHNFSERYRREVRRWATEKGLPVISIGYRNDWADEQWLDAGPLDFPHFIAGAAAVATNFFHGCVFSIRFAKPFVCETSPYRSIKVQGLMQSLGGEKHLFWPETPHTMIDACLGEPLEPSIFNHLHQYRQSSNDYLSRALGIQQLRVA